MADSSTSTLWGNLRASTERGDVHQVMRFLVLARAHDAFEAMRDYAQQKIPLIKDPYTWAPYVYWRRGKLHYPGNANGWATRYNNTSTSSGHVEAPMEWLIDGEAFWSANGDPEDQSYGARVKRALLYDVDMAFLKWQARPFFQYMERVAHENYPLGQRLGRKGLQLLDQGHVTLTEVERAALGQHYQRLQPRATDTDYGQERISVGKRATAMSPEWHEDYNAIPLPPRDPEHYFLEDHASFVGFQLLYHLQGLYKPSLHPLIAFPMPNLIASISVALTHTMPEGLSIAKKLQKVQDTLWDYWMAMALETICPFYFTGTRQEYREVLRAYGEERIDTE